MQLGSPWHALYESQQSLSSHTGQGAVSVEGGHCCWSSAGTRPHAAQPSAPSFVRQASSALAAAIPSALDGFGQAAAHAGSTSPPDPVGHPSVHIQCVAQPGSAAQSATWPAQVCATH
jgi:hypothetical protein